MPLKTYPIRRNQVLRRNALSPAQQLDAVLSRARGHASCRDWNRYELFKREIQRLDLEPQGYQDALAILSKILDL